MTSPNYAVCESTAHCQYRQFITVNSWAWVAIYFIWGELQQLGFIWSPYLNNQWSCEYDLTLASPSADSPCTSSAPPSELSNINSRRRRVEMNKTEHRISILHPSIGLDWKSHVPRAPLGPQCAEASQPTSYSTQDHFSHPLLVNGLDTLVHCFTAAVILNM